MIVRVRFITMINKVEWQREGDFFWVTLQAQHIHARVQTILLLTTETLPWAGPWTRESLR